MNELPKVHIPTREVREKRCLIQYRQRLVRQKVGVQNAIPAILSREGISSYSLMGRRSKKTIDCENPNRGMNQSDQILDLTGLAS